ncbi:winged helix-turn-helix domain-containing protein [Halonotius pteroides]|uniref:ArsR family transcriptional regulator n=1 Tax=Halonotius pteroides TaxID=268735 RepID=A0A3A6PYT8_9EURY|nr:winged helix-turn-helix domain-containing protein [Halonotius pteroides]RJX47623.1 ArsR family transcriptional regulator [Halonotius pteroides]RJX47628.1 ArsR family transcriptional regulator [Halonotius pteroides]
MSIDLSNVSDSDLNSLPSPDLDTESGPKPVAHGGGTQCVFNDTSRERTIYRQFFDLWRNRIGDRDNEPGVVAELDHQDYDWLGYPEAGRWVLVLKSKGWMGGTGEGEDWSQYYEYKLLLRQQDEDGNLNTNGKSCSLTITPQLSKLNYKDGNEITYNHGEGSLIACATTWAETSEEIESRMYDLLLTVLDDIDVSRLNADRNDDSRRIWKGEVHLRHDIGSKQPVIDTISKSEELIAYGGRSETQAGKTRQREGYLEAVIDADRWDLLGFDDTKYDIELKCYQTDGWHEYPRDHHARHPKTEAAYSGVDDDEEMPHVDEWDDMMATLRSVVSSHLQWAGVGREQLIADDYQSGSARPVYDYNHPTNRREQLRERFEAVGTQVRKEALRPNTEAVYDILQTIATERGATYDLLEERTGLARSTVQYHCRRLDESEVIERIGNPVLVVFPSLAALDESIEVLREVNPDEQVGDILDRADERRERRKQQQESDADNDANTAAETTDSDTAAGSVNSDPKGDNSDTPEETPNWQPLSDLDNITVERLAAAVDNGWVPGRHIKMRTDLYEWAGG